VSQVRILDGDRINEFEMLTVLDYMQNKYPAQHYTMSPGNQCVWVAWGSSVPINFYFVFREERIADIQID